MRCVLGIAAILAVFGCSTVVERDDRPPFRIDPTRPFRLEFGRGSGWHGLDTIRIDQDGKVVLYRLNRREQEPGWETAELQLRPDTLAEVLKAVETNNLMNLYRTYRDPDIHDGTQWVLWIKQEGHEKSVYFDNIFPRKIRGFAERLDGILSAAGLHQVTWHPVPAEESRRHERELWDSIRR